LAIMNIAAMNIYVQGFFEYWFSVPLCVYLEGELLNCMVILSMSPFFN
jgi:hypothetical protein